MKQRAIMLAAALGVAWVSVAAWLLVFRSGPRGGGPLRHEVYVWQRAWTGPVREAVARRGTNFSALCVLKAEVSWKDGKPQVARVAVDYPTLAEARRPVGIALRIGPYSGPFLQAVRGRGRESAPSPADKDQSRFMSVATIQNQNATALLTDLAASIVAEARSNHLDLGELEMDFDCAESKLDGYRVWVEAIQRRVAPLPVTITALPSWLDSRAFKRLAAVATNYVLQVHSVERPKSLDAPFTLCDPRAARRAVERAGRIGVPFRVALPTYGYTLAFDPSGRFIGLSAEGPRPNWPTNALLREVRSDATAIARLVQDWTASRPAAMRGVIWYRLPVATDKRNWRWETLREIVGTPASP
jgi:hypothetical protein